MKILLEAFKVVKEKEKKLKLVIVGNQNNFRTKDEEVIRLLSDKKLNENIIFTGYINNNELKKLIAEAKILVQPSLYEGFGIPPLEALTLGTNVIVSNIEVFNEIYGEYNVKFFDINNINSLSSTILKNLNNNKNNYVNLEKFSYFEVSKSIIEELEYEK